MQRAAAPRAASAAPRLPQPRRLLAVGAAPRRACVALASCRPLHALCRALRSRAPQCEPPAALCRALLPPLRAPSRSGRCCLARAAEASADAAAALWVKPRDVAGARYAEVEDVDLQQTVSKLIARWVAQAKLDVDPSLVTLRLVKCGARKPSSPEEAAAAELDDPSLTLREAGVTGTAWLLAVVIAPEPAVDVRALVRAEFKALRQELMSAGLLPMSAGGYAQQYRDALLATLWVKSLGVASARYVKVEDVDLLQTVGDFVARWVSEEKLDVDRGLVTLRLVRCAGEAPTAAEEAAAAELEDPSLTLREAGVTDGCSLLVFVASSTQALHELEAALQQARVYQAALGRAFDPEPALPCYASLPLHPSMLCSTRASFKLVGSSVTIMRRAGSREIASWLLGLLLHGEFAAYIKGPPGTGKSHLLYDIVLLLSATHRCRVVYEHDCASWASLHEQPIQATLHFLRAIATAFAADAEVLRLCSDFTAAVAVMVAPADAEYAVGFRFLPQLGDLCKRLNLKVFFVFDQHHSLTPEMRAAFPYNLPESKLLRTPQLRHVGMVVVSGSADSEYFLKIATWEPQPPMRLVTSGFDLDELRLFLRHECMFQQSPLDDDLLRKLSVATNRYPLELALLREAHNALQARGADEPVTVQRCIDVYEHGDEVLGVPGRMEAFAAHIAAFDKRVHGDPSERKRLIYGVVRMQLEVPRSAFPHAVLLNLGICYESDVPQSAAFSQLSPRGGPAEYVCAVTPAALKAAVSFYALDLQRLTDFTARE